MKKSMVLFNTILLVMGLLAGLAYGDQIEKKTSELVITITGFESTKGVARIALVNSVENFSAGTPFKGFNAKISDNRVIQSVIVPYGEYAIKIYHDENGNNALDKMMFGIPKEKYGFSNNARAKFGPPDYQDAVFKIESATSSMAIEIK